AAPAERAARPALPSRACVAGGARWSLDRAQTRSRSRFRTPPTTDAGLPRRQRKSRVTPPFNSLGNRRLEARRPARGAAGRCKGGPTVAIKLNGPNGIMPPLDPARPDKQDRTKKGNKARAEKLAKYAQGRAERAADNLFRVSHGKHEQLSSMADNKAHNMITICVAVIGLSATQV